MSLGKWNRPGPLGASPQNLPHQTNIIGGINGMLGWINRISSLYQTFNKYRPIFEIAKGYFSSPGSTEAPAQEATSQAVRSRKTTKRYIAKKRTNKRARHSKS
jgi:hypothetical protein